MPTWYRAYVTVNNDGTNQATFEIEQTILGENGQPLASGVLQQLSLGFRRNGRIFLRAHGSESPALVMRNSPPAQVASRRFAMVGWSPTNMKTRPSESAALRWEANEGFFLNGKRVELKGTCDHQDHAGVGVAVPDELNVFRVIGQLKKWVPTPFAPATILPISPELLDACDRLGMLVMDEKETAAWAPARKCWIK